MVCHSSVGWWASSVSLLIRVSHAAAVRWLKSSHLASPQDLQTILFTAWKWLRFSLVWGIYKHVNIRMCVHWGKKYTPTNSLLQLSARIFLYYTIHKTLLKLIPSPWSYFILQSFFFFFCPGTKPDVKHQQFLWWVQKIIPSLQTHHQSHPSHNFKFLYVIF